MQRIRTSCVLDAGTELTSHSFLSSGDAAQVSAPEIQAKCSWSVAYSKDFHAAGLVLK